MKRRKFLIGLGAASAGSVAAMGTGALSSSDVDRGMTAQVVGDHSGAYLDLRPWSDYAKLEEGQLVLHFDEDTKNNLNSNSGGGQTDALGLNQDSVNQFSPVFKLTNNTPGEQSLDVWITDTHERVRFFWCTKDGDFIAYATKANARTLQSATTNKSVFVGVEIDLDDYEQNGDIFTKDDDFTVHAEASD